MAKRKAWQRALSGLGIGMANVGETLARRKTWEDQQDRLDARQEASATAQSERQRQDDLRAFERDVRAKVATGDLEPMQAATMLASQGMAVSPEFFEPSRPSPRRRMEKAVGASISGAKLPEDVPDQDRILSAGRREGLTDPIEWPIPGGQVEIADPYVEFKPEVREYGDLAKTRRRTLESAPTEKITGTDKTGATFTQMLPKSALADPVRTSPSAAEQGTLEGQKRVATDTTVFGDEALTALRAKTEGRIANMVENMTRGAKVQTAAATSGASKRATLAPDIIASEVDRSKQLAAGKENSTEGERRAAANFTPLVNAHTQLLALEAAGTRVRTGMQTASQSPSLNWMVPETQQQYLQAGRDFISTLGLIRSGVAVPETEVTRFMSTMLGTSNDNPQTLKNKQASREVFISAMQAMIGRSGEEAGRLLASLYDGGNMPDGLALKLDPMVQQGLLKNMKKQPMFDVDGNFLGVAKSK